MSNMKQRYFKSFVAVLAAVTAPLMAGCEMALPTGPSELTKGIVIYEDATFLGKSAHVTTSIRDLWDVKGPCKSTDVAAGVIVSILGQEAVNSTTESWDDCISSLQVTPGSRAIVYSDPDFHGRSLEVVSDVANLQLAAANPIGMNDQISSIRVVPPQ